MHRKIVVGLTALAAVGMIGSVSAQERADRPTNPFAAAPADAIRDGRAVFNGSCASCHGQNGVGGERGPSLTGTLSHAEDDYDLFLTIQKGLPGTAMPAFGALQPDQLWRLATFIRSLSGGASVAAKAPIKGDAAAGQKVFFGKGQCASCHEVNGQGAVVGPDLSAAGKLADVRKSLQHPGPRSNGYAAFQFVEVTLKDGHKVTGVLKFRDSAVLHLQTPEGAFHLLTNDKVKSVKPTGETIPTDTAKRLTDGEMDDLVAYLTQQKARDFRQTIKANPPAVLTPARLENSRREPRNWLTYWGDYAGRHFSDLTQITKVNARQLQAKWIARMTGDRPLEATPIVVDGVMYVSGNPGDVFAFDARTGIELWRFHRNQDKRNPYQINPSNRGVAVIGGRVIFNTLDNNLIALDARTGRQLWEKNVADTMLSYTMTGAPLAVDNMVVVGMSGGEGGVRGFLDAYDAATGERVWRFMTVPGAGEPGNETWSGDSWKTGGGATWLTGGYDPKLKQLYWTIGNPGPDFNPEQRKGDNLYTNTVVALDPKTGKLIWHYQFTPNDGHDWDSTEDLVLTDRVIDGKLRKVMLHADRNGFFYVLDRTNGQFISGNAFVTQNWMNGFDAKGRPNVRPESVPTPQGVLSYPAVGGTNFQAPSYDEKSGLFYMAYLDTSSFVRSATATYEAGKLFYGRGDAPRPPPPRPPVQGLMAWDPIKHKAVWTFPLTRNSLSAGLVATRGGVVFAATAEGWLYGVDSKTGRQLWRFYTGQAINAAPMSYAVDGKQYIAVTAGAAVLSFALPQ